MKVVLSKPPAGYAPNPRPMTEPESLAFARKGVDQEGWPFLEPFRSFIGGAGSGGAACGLFTRTRAR